MKTEITDLLKYFRSFHGLTQPEAGAILGGVHWITVHRWEKGINKIPSFVEKILLRWHRSGLETFDGREGLDALGMILAAD